MSNTHSSRDNYAAVGIIAARGGSKRVPRKNIRSFLGRPMISYTISTAIESKCFSRVIVSTDDPEIAEVEQQYGAEVPFLRPAELADEFTPTRPVLVHAIREITNLFGKPDCVCSLSATSPLMRANDIRNGFDSLLSHNVEFAVSVASYKHPIQRALGLLEDGCVKMIDTQHIKTRSQDLEVAYHDAAQFYWGNTDAFLSGRSVFETRTMPIVIPMNRVVDIDTPDDWQMAESLYLAIDILENKRSSYAKDAQS